MFDAHEEIGTVEVAHNRRIHFELVARHGVRSMRVSRSVLIKEEWSAPTHLFTAPYKMPVDNGTRIVEPFNELMTMLNVIAEKIPNFKLED